MFRKIKARLLNDDTVVEMDPKEPQNHPALTPRDDPSLTHLMEQALRGNLPVYFAIVPIGLLVPFDIDYRPDLHPAGKQLIDRAFEDGQQGKHHYVIVYQRGIWFVTSDDYPYVFAYMRGRPDYVPCWVLGKPESDLVKDIQGPVDPNGLRAIFGIA